MADMNSLEDLDRWMALMREQYEAGHVSAKELADAQKDYAAGIKSYTRNLEASMKSLGTSFKDFGKDIYDGKQGASTFNNTLSSGADAVESYAKKFGPAGIAIGKMTQAMVLFANAALKQSDLLFDSYSKISRAGVIGAGAMSDVFDKMNDFGYTQDQLGEMGAVLAANAKNLAVFNKSAISGANQFQEIAAGLQESNLRQQFFALGMNVTDINSAGAGYIVQLGRLGKSTQATTAGAAEYIKEMETLTRLTGLERQEMEANRESLTNIDSYYAALQDLGPKQSKVMQDFMDALKAVDPSGETTKGMAEIVGNIGIASSDAAQKIYQQSGFDVLSVRNKLLAGDYANVSEAMADFGKSVGQNYQLQKDLSRYNAGYGMGLKNTTAFMSKQANAYNEVADAVNKSAGGFDKTTKNQAGIRDDQIKQAQNMQNFVNLGVTPATAAMELLTDVVTGLTSLLPGAAAAQNRQEAKKRGVSVEQVQSEKATDSYNRSNEFSGTEGSGAPVAPGGGGAGRGQDISGLNIKSSESVSGGDSAESLIALAFEIQEKLGGNLKYFSGLNDSRAKDGKSKHGLGQALDIVLKDPKSYPAVLDMIKQMPGVSFAQFEQPGQRNSNGSVSSGAHIHAEVSAANGAILSGPSSGYKPNLTMHGTEAVVPLSSSALPAGLGGSSEADSSMLAEQLARMDEMISIMKNQLGVSTKLMQYST